jgi:hypothetical protein
MFVNGSELNEQLLWRTFQGCFLPRFDPFGQINRQYSSYCFLASELSIEKKIRYSKQAAYSQSIIKWRLVSTSFKIYLEILFDFYITFTISYYNTINIFHSSVHPHTKRCGKWKYAVVV